MNTARAGDVVNGDPPEQELSVPRIEGTAEMSTRRHLGLVERDKDVVEVHAIHSGRLQSSYGIVKCISLLEKSQIFLHFDSVNSEPSRSISWANTMRKKTWVQHTMRHTGSVNIKQTVLQQ